MDTQRLRELLDQRDQLDEEIARAVGSTVTTKKERKPLTCGICGSESHTARTCSQKGLTNGKTA